MRIPTFLAPWRRSTESLLRAAAILTLFGLALMVWSMLDPTPLPVMLAMSLGQVLGTVAFALYGLAIWKDLRRIRRVRRESLTNIPVQPAAPKPTTDEAAT
jgi:hypothetical protein